MRSFRVVNYVTDNMSSRSVYLPGIVLIPERSTMNHN